MIHIQYILDASALFAFINQETGADKVEKVLQNTLMSAVNISEVAAVLSSLGMPMMEIKEILQELIWEIIPFDEEQALCAAKLRKETKYKELFLGDRKHVYL